MNDLAMNQAIIERYRCPHGFVSLRLTGEVSDRAGFFRFGPDAICYGQCASGYTNPHPTQPLYDAAEDVKTVGSTVWLPFNPTKIADNLRFERYVSDGSRQRSWLLKMGAVRRAYYTVRPLLPILIRKYFQRIYFGGWHKRPFPNWPVDLSVEKILERILVLSMKAKGVDEVPQYRVPDALVDSVLRELNLKLGI
jgi:hypothetical protein